MPRITLSLAVHNHQPIGSFDFVFAEAYERAYEPMLAALERHPGVRLALHHTGPLRDWLLVHHPDHLARLRALVRGGYLDMDFLINDRYYSGRRLKPHLEG